MKFSAYVKDFVFGSPSIRKAAGDSLMADTDWIITSMLKGHGELDEWLRLDCPLTLRENPDAAAFGENSLKGYRLGLWIGLNVEGPQLGASKLKAYRAMETKLSEAERVNILLGLRERISEDIEACASGSHLTPEMLKRCEDACYWQADFILRAPG